MKRTILLALIVLSFLPSIEARTVDGCLAPSDITKRPKSWVKPKILTDKQHEDGYRRITTTTVGFAKTALMNKLSPVSCSLTKRKRQGESTYAITFYYWQRNEIHIKEGSRLLLKFEDGSIMTLRIANPIGVLENERHVQSNLTVTYSCSPSYSMTEEQLLKITSQEVVKLRMEIDTGEGYVDVSTDNTKGLFFSDTLRECYYAISEKEKQSNGLYDGF